MTQYRLNVGSSGNEYYPAYRSIETEVGVGAAITSMEYRVGACHGCWVAVEKLTTEELESAYLGFIYATMKGRLQVVHILSEGEGMEGSCPDQ